MKNSKHLLITILHLLFVFILSPILIIAQGLQLENITSEIDMCLDVDAGGSILTGETLQYASPKILSAKPSKNLMVVPPGMS